MKKGKIIAFIGIDGAGKTTVIRGVKEALEKQGGKCKRIYMGLGRNYHIPFLRKFTDIYSKLRYHSVKTNKKKTPQGVVRDNYRKRNFLWLLVQYTEFWVRYLKAKKLVKTHYILFDRYFYDGLVLSGNKSFEFFKMFTPKPDKAFLIWAPSKLILKRKQEANLKNIEDFYKKAEFLRKFFNIEKIDNSKKLNIVVNKIVEKIK